MRSTVRSLKISLIGYYAAANLLQLDRFKQGLKITLAKTLIPFSLNNLEEDGTDQVLGEYLQ